LFPPEVLEWLTDKTFWDSVQYQSGSVLGTLAAQDARPCPYEVQNFAYGAIMHFAAAFLP